MLKGQVMKAASVNCRLAQHLFILMDKDFSALNPTRWEVEQAVEELAAANDVGTDLVKINNYWAKRQLTEAAFIT